MIYIVTALKSEAQAFVDKYKLKKTKLANYILFKHEYFTLIISGVGIENSSLATATLLNHFSINSYDTFLNIGICGASKKYLIGDLLEISSINFNNNNFKINQENKNIITCVHEEVFENKYDIVDMESYGFYKALINEISDIRILKVVSDNFEPEKVTKEQTKLLIFNHVEEILKKVQT